MPPKKTNQAFADEAKLYRHLRRFIDKPCPTNAQIAKSLGLTESIVIHRVRQLRDQGYILPVTIQGCKRKIIFGDGSQTEISMSAQKKNPPKPKPPPKVVWLEEEKARAFELQARGMTMKNIARHLNRSRNAVCGLFYRERERGRSENLVRNGEVTLAKYAMSSEARAKMNETWEKLSA